MPCPSVIPQVRERLEAYLDERELVYQRQPGQPTLPATPEGKVNVRGVTQSINLKISQEKYLYERVELSQLINLVAKGQGLLPIGSRLTQDAGNKALKQAKQRNRAQSMQSELLKRLKDAVTEIETLKAQNLRLHAQLDAVQAGIFIRVDH